MKQERLGIVLRSRDKAAARRLAEVEGESIACVVRRLIRNEAERRGIWPGEGEWVSFSTFMRAEDYERDLRDLCAEEKEQEVMND
jgi:hypothetical protein